MWLWKQWMKFLADITECITPARPIPSPPFTPPRAPLCLLLINRDVRAARGSCPRAEGAAAETRWLCAQEEQRRRAEAMQRRNEEGGEEFTPVLCVLSCQKSNSSAEKETSAFWHYANWFPLSFRVAVWRFEFFCNQETNGLTKQITEHSVEDSRGPSRRYQRCPCYVWEVREEIKRAMKTLYVWCYWSSLSLARGLAAPVVWQSLRAVSSVEKSV